MIWSKKARGERMRKIEDAIAYFEEAIRESDEIISECSEALKKELTEQKGHFVIALDAMRKTQHCENTPFICRHYQRKSKKCMVTSLYMKSMCPPTCPLYKHAPESP